MPLREGRTLPLAQFDSAERCAYVVSVCNAHDDLVAALRTLIDHADCLRDFVSEGGSRHMVGALHAILDVDTAMDAVRAALAKVQA